MTKSEQTRQNILLSKQIWEKLNKGEIETGYAFKNSKALSDYFGLSYKTSRDTLLNEGLIRNYIDFYKEGQKILVSSIKNDDNDFAYMFLIENLFVQYCLRVILYIPEKAKKIEDIQKEKGKLIIELNDLGVLLGFHSEHFDTIKYKEEFLNEISNVVLDYQKEFSILFKKDEETLNMLKMSVDNNDNNTIRNKNNFEKEWNKVIIEGIEFFFSETIKSRNKHILEILNFLQDVDIISYSKELIVTEGKTTGVNIKYQRYGENKIRRCSISIQEGDERVATLKEIEEYNELVKDVIYRFKCKNIGEIFFLGRAKKFYEKLKARVGLDMGLYDIREGYNINNNPNNLIQIKWNNIDEKKFKQELYEDRKKVALLFQKDLLKHKSKRIKFDTEMGALKHKIKEKIFNYLLEELIVAEKEDVDLKKLVYEIREDEYKGEY